MFKQSKKTHSGYPCHAHSAHAALCGVLAMFLSACGGGGGSEAPPPPVNTNTAPTVSGDSPVLTSKVSGVMLSATGSDADGDTLTYRWTQDSGTAVTNQQGFDSATPSFDTPDSVDTLEFTVSVSDGQANSTSKVLVVVTEDMATAAFVDGDGGSDTSGDGSIEDPYATIGFALAAADNTDLYLKTLADNAAYDETAETLTISNSRSVYGGYAADWTRDVVTNQTIVIGAARAMEWFNVDQQAWVSGLNLTAISPEGTDLSRRPVQPIFVSSGAGSMSIENNMLIAEDAEPDGTLNRSAISNTIKVSDLATLLITDNVIVAGSGGDATGEGERTIGIGDDGDVGDGGTVSQTAARGGTGSEGANGGVGGIGANGFGEGGSGGAAGALSRAGCGEGGAGGPYTSDRVARGTDGGDGCNGATGSEGNGGRGFGNLATFGYSDARGSEGGNGATGTGGGGGGGGASNRNGVNGGGGGGGGEAGGGGIGGRGGSGGGASLGIEIFNVSNAIIERNEITTADGGNGSTGGRGAAGGAGGTGGTGAQGNDLGALLGSGARGGDGGDGGNGGRGGRGGAGGGGPSIGIFVGPGLSPVIRDNTLVTGDGGSGGPSLGGVARSAGRGGWSYAVIDGDINDGATPVLTSNSVTTGAPGSDGSPSTGIGMAGEINE